MYYGCVPNDFLAREHWQNPKAKLPGKPTLFPEEWIGIPSSPPRNPRNPNHRLFKWPPAKACATWEQKAFPKLGLPNSFVEWIRVWGLASDPSSVCHSLWPWPSYFTSLFLIQKIKIVAYLCHRVLGRSTWQSGKELGLRSLNHLSWSPGTATY